MKNKFALLLSLLLLGIAGPACAESLTVAVAANVKYAFDDLQDAFRKESGIDIKPIFSSSGKITAQVKSGAPYDVFLSADMEYPKALHREGFAAAAPKIYGYGSLVVWTMNDYDLRNWPALMGSAGVNKIAIPNPKLAPYGREALKALRYLKVYEAVEAKLVYGESVGQTNQYIHSRAADIGFTAKSVVVSPEMKGQGKWVDVPRDAYEPIAQGVVILKHGRETNAAAAAKFYDFLASAKARAIFQQYGYLLP
ncbi:MAG: molybdate ABC transporter substrate-binding protein [Sulfurimicrobium sp.]|nr:molybdate ABC transporter substrate-binding protein [Sulfurimicrobium sp.]